MDGAPSIEGANLVALLLPPAPLLICQPTMPVRTVANGALIELDSQFGLSMLDSQKGSDPLQCSVSVNSAGTPHVPCAPAGIILLPAGNATSERVLDPMENRRVIIGYRNHQRKVADNSLRPLNGDAALAIKEARQVNAVFGGRGFVIRSVDALVERSLKGGLDLIAAKVDLCAPDSLLTRNKAVTHPSEFVSHQHTVESLHGYADQRRSFGNRYPLEFIWRASVKHVRSLVSSRRADTFNGLLDGQEVNIGSPKVKAVVRLPLLARNVSALIKRNLPPARTIVQCFAGAIEQGARFRESNPLGCHAYMFSKRVANSFGVCA